MTQATIQDVLVLAHDNVRVRSLERLRSPRMNGRFDGLLSEEARPFLTFKEEMVFYFNEEEVRAFLAPPAHTDGDTFVYFPESDVLHLGDVFRTTSFPIIDVYNGGTLQGTIEALELADAKWGQEETWTANDLVPIVYYELGGGSRYRP